MQAVDAAGNLAPVSEPVTVTRPVPCAVAAPTAVAGTPADAATTLTWSAGEGSGVTGFRVYRRTAPGAAWTLVGSTEGTSYQDTSAPQGKALYYVAAVGASGAESVPSAEAVVDRLTPATVTGPAAPRLTLVSSGIPEGTLAKSATVIGVKPGAGDEARVLKGYSWEVFGACGGSGTRLTTTGTIEWTAPYNGPCTATVFAVDAYGRIGEQGSSLEFFVGR